MKVRGQSVPYQYHSVKWPLPPLSHSRWAAASHLPKSQSFDAFAFLIKNFQPFMWHINHFHLYLGRFLYFCFISEIWLKNPTCFFNLRNEAKINQFMIIISQTASLVKYFSLPFLKLIICLTPRSGSRTNNLSLESSPRTSKTVCFHGDFVRRQIDSSLTIGDWQIYELFYSFKIYNGFIDKIKNSK